MLTNLLRTGDIAREFLTWTDVTYVACKNDNVLSCDVQFTASTPL